MRAGTVFGLFGATLMLGTLGCGKAAPTAAPSSAQPSYGVQAGEMMPATPAAGAESSTRAAPGGTVILPGLDEQRERAEIEATARRMETLRQQLGKLRAAIRRYEAELRQVGEKGRQEIENVLAGVRARERELSQILSEP